MATNIPDGYTVTDQTIVVDGQTVLRFDFRPMRGLIRQHLATAELTLAEQGYAGVKRSAQMVAEALADHLVRWDRLDEKGQPVAITPQAVAALDPRVANFLELQVFYWVAPEHKPKDDAPPAPPMTGETATEKNS